jgi:uncharacterized circularly permuted ATP-grasp superfamily protein
MADRTLTAFYDEVYAADGAPRPHTAALAAALERLGGERLAATGRRRDAIFLQQGTPGCAAPAWSCTRGRSRSGSPPTRPGG